MLRTVDNWLRTPRSLIKPGAYSFTQSKKVLADAGIFRISLPRQCSRPTLAGWVNLRQPPPVIRITHTPRGSLVIYETTETGLLTVPPPTIICTALYLRETTRLHGGESACHVTPELRIKPGRRRFCSQTFSAALFTMKPTSLTLVTAVLLAASSLVGAVPVDPQEVEKLSAEGLFLLRLGPDVDPVWKTEEEKWELKKAGVNFMDVTETWASVQSNPALQKPTNKVSTTTTCRFVVVVTEWTMSQDLTPHNL